MKGWYDWGGSTLQFPARRIYRSPASRATQTICATFRVFKFTAAYYEIPWRLNNTTQSCVDVAPGRHAIFRDRNFFAQPEVGYSTDMVVTWHAYGSLVGRAVYDYGHPNDYSCQTHRCSTGWGHRGVAYMMLHY